MSTKIFKNISNHTSSNHYKLYTDTYQQNIPSIIVKTQTTKSSSKLNKKSNNKLPKYLINPLFNQQKQKLLFDIQKQNHKLKIQNATKLYLQRKLQKKTIQNQKKLLSLQKNNQSQTDGIQRTITSSLQKPFLLQPNQNYQKSITTQIQLLKQQIQKNQSTINKLKQCKKYTRYLQNQQQKNTFTNQLKSMKRYKKKIKVQIQKLKRIHQNKKNLRIQQLLLEGEIQNNVEMENIQIYKLIEQLKWQLKQSHVKKANLNKKKFNLVQQIQNLKDKLNINDQFIQLNYRPHISSFSKTAYSSGFNSSKTSTLCRPLTSNLNDLVSLKQQDCQEQDSIQNVNYKNSIKNAQNNLNIKDTIKQKATQTVKVNSNIPSDDGQFMGISSNNSKLNQNTIKQEQQRKTIQKLQKKYFYEEQDFQSDQQNSQKQYGSQNYDQQEDFDEESQIQNNQQHKKKPSQKMISAKQKCNPPQPVERVWSTRPSRGVSL